MNPRLNPPAGPSRDIPPTGLEKPRMGAENPRRCPEAEMTTPKPKAAKNPSEVLTQ
jgi:hypothetical protein